MPVLVQEFPVPRNRSYVWYGVPTDVDNGIALIDTRHSFYPNDWVDDEHSLFKYYLDTRPCDGNTLLQRGAHTGIRVWLYRTTKGVGCEFLGEFRVKEFKRCSKSYVLLQQHTLPDRTDEMWTARHTPLAECGPHVTPTCRSGSENMHYVVLDDDERLGFLIHEGQTRNGIVYTWKGQRVCGQYTPDYEAHELSTQRICLIESKYDLEGKDSDENVEKLKALSIILPPVYRCILMCGHDEDMSVFEYINGIEHKLTYETLFAKAPTKRPRSL